MGGEKVSFPIPTSTVSSVLAQFLNWQVDPTIIMERVGPARKIATGETCAYAAARPS